MNYEKISNGSINIFKTKLEGIDKEALLKEIYTNKNYLFFDREYNDESVRLPGIQMSSDLMIGDQLTITRKKSFDASLDIYKQEYPRETIYSSLVATWIYISTASNPISAYHDHVIFSKKDIGLPTSYTWIYYIQTPDNCVGDEGKIFFKEAHDHTTDDSNAFKFFPEEGCLYMWDSLLPHRPELSPNSTFDRVIIAGNVCLNTTIK
jgi:hypothetical protein